MSTKNEAKRYRVRQCSHCKARNIIAAPESETNPTLVCPKCGEHPGMISIYHDCPHNPVHRWDEKALCIKLQAKTRKRQKQVFSTGEIPHLWAHRVQESARNPQGNLYFDGDTIYSYGSHFPIAVHVANKRGNRAVLFTTRGYSATTGQHKHVVRGAIPKDLKVFEVPVVRSGWHGSHVYADSDSELHRVNLKAYVSELTEAIAKATKARTLWSKRWKTREARRVRQQCIAYVRFFRLKLPSLPKVPVLTATQVRKLKARESFLASDEHKAVLVIERARREMLADFAQRRAAAGAIAEWRSGNPYVRLPHGIPVMLRIRGNEVETSMGARVPLSHAKRALRFVREVIARGTEYQRNGHSLHVGHYVIDRIESNGTLHAGCHHIAFGEIEAIAPRLESVAEAAEA